MPSDISIKKMSFWKAAKASEVRKRDDITDDSMDLVFPAHQVPLLESSVDTIGPVKSPVLIPV